MRRLMVILTLLSLLASSFVFMAFPVSANDKTEKCWQYAVSVNNPTTNPGTVTLALNDFSPITHTYQASYSVQPGETKTVSVQGLFPLSAGSFIGSESGTNVTYVALVKFGQVPFNVCAAVFGQIGDGRINDGPDQEGAPLAAYCSNGGIAVWDINDQGQGTLAFTSTQDEISSALAKATSSGQNVLVGQGLGDSLYALSTNQLTLVGPDVKESGKTYDFITTPSVCG